MSGYHSDWDPPAYMDALWSIYQVHSEALAGLGALGAWLPASNVTVSSLGLLDGKFLYADYSPIQVETFHLGSAIIGR